MGLFGTAGTVDGAMENTLMDPMEWLTTVRKLDPDLLSAMGVRATDHEALGRVAALPYRRGGKNYAAKFRKPEPKDWRSTQGVSRGLYNEDDLDRLQSLPIVLTEGELDTITAMQCGWERAVSLPDGWTEDGGKRQILTDNEKRFRDSPYVVVAGDADKTGQSLPVTLSQLLRGHDVREARYPDGCKDLNDVLMIHGEAAVQKALTEARVLDPPGGFVTGFSDLPAMSERRVLRTGLGYPFDNVVALQLSALSVWTGIPGSGKSTFLTWVAEKVTQHENIRCGMMMFETHPHDLRDNLSLIRSGSDWRSLDDVTRASLSKTLDRRFRIVHRTFEDDAAHRIGWLEDTIRQLAVRDGCKLIIVDPWNELEHLPEPGESMTQYINWALQRLRQLAEQLEIHIALVSHPKKVEAGKVPTGYDVADSAAFFNKPSLGVSVHPRKDSETGETFVELNVWKVRNARLYGFQRASIYCDFDPLTSRYVKRSSPDK